MYTLESCCFVLSLRVGTVMTLIWSLIVANIPVGLAGLVPDIPYTVRSEIMMIKRLEYLFLIPSVISGFYGTFKKKPKFLLLYIIYAVLNFIIDFFVSVTLATSRETHEKLDPTTQQSDATSILFIVSLVLLQFLQFYCIWVVYSYYKYLQENDEED